jgi:hypothetical protein
VCALGYGVSSLIDPLGQVQRRAQISDLCQGQGNLHHLIGAGVVLFDGHAILEGADDDILLQGCGAFVDKGDNGRVEIMFDGKHGRKPRVSPGPWQEARAGGQCLADRVMGAGPRRAWSLNGLIEARSEKGNTLRHLPSVMAMLLLAGCAGLGVGPDSATERMMLADPDDARARAQGFVAVVSAVEPVAEAECRAQGVVSNCDFQILIDDRRGMPPNAFQTRDAAGRPMIVFTVALIQDVRNTDELAFVMSHEAAHHILGHLDRQEANAARGAQVFGDLAAITGTASPEAIQAAQELGAAVGQRSYSKDFELEADALGTVIAARAGFNPLRGSEFFFRIPDPGNVFLSTHPRTADRVAIVRQVSEGLGFTDPTAAQAP